MVATTITHVRGRPVSGRTWKMDTALAVPAHAQIASKSRRTPFDVRKAKEAVMKQKRASIREMEDEKAAAKAKTRAARVAKQKRKEENEKKAEVFQRVTNAKKLKRLSKKQLKQYTTRAIDA